MVDPETEIGQFRAMSPMRLHNADLVKRLQFFEEDDL